VRDVCGCAAPCDEISYDVSYSLSRWPAESFDGDEAFIDIFQARHCHTFTFYLSKRSQDSPARKTEGKRNRGVARNCT